MHPVSLHIGNVLSETMIDQLSQCQKTRDPKSVAYTELEAQLVCVFTLKNIVDTENALSIPTANNSGLESKDIDPPVTEVCTCFKKYSLVKYKLSKLKQYFS